MASSMEIVKVQIDRKIIDRRDWVKYLVLVNWHARQLGDLIEWTPDAAFNEFLENQVQGYLKGSEPHRAIQSAIMNIADDYIAGREVTIRAGDFIALQNQFRGSK